MRLAFCAVVGFVIAALSPALAGPVACSTSFQGYRVCSGPGGATSTETQWQGMTVGQDSDGSRWATRRWMGTDIHDPRAARTMIVANRAVRLDDRRIK